MKKKRFKIVRIIILAIAFIIITTIVAPGLFVNKAIKIAIEKAGTKALTVDVNLDRADLSALRGKISLHDLIVDNPQGYQHETLLELNQANIQVDTKSLLSDEVYIENIILDGIKIVFEQKGFSGNNLQDLIERLPEKQDNSEESGKTLHIKNLEITNTEVQVKLLPVPGKIDTIPLKLSTIQMTDLGSDNKMDIVDLSRKILLAIIAGIAQQGTGIIPDDMLNSFMSELQKFDALSGVLLDSGKKILEAGTDIGKEAETIGENLRKGVEETGKGITESLKGILGPKKEE